MNDYMQTLKEGLKDPELNGVECLIPDRYALFVKALQQFPDAKYVSEWRYELGHISYRYHVHNEQKGGELRKLVEEKKTSRHPKLVRVYSRSELDTILAPTATGSH